MILELDCGNSRVKWRLLSMPVELEAVVQERGAFAWGELSPQQFSPLCRLGVARVRLLSVAGVERTDALTKILFDLFGCEIERAQVSGRCAGLTCGYDTPAQLGVDRWLAVLAAAARFPSEDLIVVDAGSAITVDIVGEGGHLGGFIAPGANLMRSALFTGTAAVKVPEVLLRLPAAPGRNTADAVSGALMLMVLGLVTQARQHFAPSARVLLTGGDGEILSGQIEGSVWLPDLVLEGLAVALPS